MTKRTTVGCPVHMEVGKVCRYCLNNEHVIDVPDMIPEIRRINAGHMSVIASYRRMIETLADYIKSQQV